MQEQLEIVILFIFKTWIKNGSGNPIVVADGGQSQFTANYSLRYFLQSLKFVKLDPDPEPHWEKVTEKQLVPDPQMWPCLCGAEIILLSRSQSQN